MLKHCVSLELAKELKEAEWKKSTQYYWVAIIKNGEFNLEYCLARRGMLRAKDEKSKLPAPLATEILEELPENVRCIKRPFGWANHKFEGYF